MDVDKREYNLDRDRSAMTDVRSTSISNLESVIVRLEDQIERMAGQLEQLDKKLQPVLVPDYSAQDEKAYLTESDRIEQSPMAEKIEASISNIRKMASHITTLVDRVDC